MADAKNSFVYVWPRRIVTSVLIVPYKYSSTTTTATVEIETQGLPVNDHWNGVYLSIFGWCVKENAMEEEDPLVMRTLEWLFATVYFHLNIKTKGRQLFVIGTVNFIG